MRILLVEDDEDNRDIQRRILNRLGYTVEAVSTGEEAVEKANEVDIGFVFMDYKLPGIDGREAAKQIRENRASHCPIIVALTGYIESKSDPMEGKDFDAILEKPISIEDFRKILAFFHY
jgi:CheY-like chemotaxis protein